MMAVAAERWGDCRHFDQPASIQPAHSSRRVFESGTSPEFRLVVPSSESSQEAEHDPPL
jgi:hypothetical protein